MGSPASRRATNLTLSSMTEHSFHGIHFPPRKGRKCNLCVRYDLLPMSRVAQLTGFLHILSLGSAGGKMTRFEQFFKERQCLINVNEHSIEWYRQAFHWLPTENPTDSDLKPVVAKMRDGGLKSRSVNS